MAIICGVTPNQKVDRSMTITMKDGKVYISMSTIDSGDGTGTVLAGLWVELPVFIAGLEDFKRELLAQNSTKDELSK